MYTNWNTYMANVELELRTKYNIMARWIWVTSDDSEKTTVTVCKNKTIMTEYDPIFLKCPTDSLNDVHRKPGFGLKFT